MVLKMSLLLILAISTSFMTGCCSDRSPLPVHQLLSTKPDYLFDEDRLSVSLFDRLQINHTPTSVLVLSGGGSDGAWGAGFLQGWNDSMPVPPSFDVVTGVSTGALLATGAFLEDKKLLLAYTQIDNDDIKGGRFFLTIPFSDSIYSSTPLENTIRKYIGNDVIDRVSNESLKSKRRLYVASTNLDAGKLTIWDLTAIAVDKNYELYRKVIYASASVPLIFPPVEIDGEFHVDGGVRANLFLRQDMLSGIIHAHREAVQRLNVLRTQSEIDKTSQSSLALRNLMPQPPDMPHVYIIINGTLAPNQQRTGDCLVPLALRTLGQLADAGNVANLYAIESLAGENHFAWNLSYIPSTDELPLMKDVRIPDSMDFDKSKMTSLYKAAEAFGNSAQRWSLKVPELDNRPYGAYP